MDPEQTSYMAPVTPVPKRHRKVKIALAVVASLILVGGVGLGVYAWREAVSSEKLRTAELRIGGLEESLAQARRQSSQKQPEQVEVQKPFVVKELGFKFTPGDDLEGLTYTVSTPSGSGTSSQYVEFSTAEVLQALEDVPDSRGKDWMIGDVMTVTIVSKADVDKDKKLKDNIIKEMPTGYLVEIQPQNSPDGQPGFSAYTQARKGQRQLLLEALKQAEANE